MPSILSLTRYIAEIGMTLSLSSEVIATAFVYLHSAIKELSLTQLGSDAVALATAAIVLACKVKEVAIKQNEIIEVAVKLASDKPTLSIELFAERKRILREKVGFFETLILRLHELDFELGFFYLGGISSNPTELQVANKLLLDFYRSALVLSVPCEALAEGALAWARICLSDGKLPDFSQHPWLPKLLEDVYT
jgi:hypothetical protein